MKRLLKWLTKNARERRMYKAIEIVYCIAYESDRDKGGKLHDLRELRDYLSATIDNVRQSYGR